MENRYKLLKAIASPVDEKGATPLLGYVLHDNKTNKPVLFNRFEACSKVISEGCENAEAKTREFEGEDIVYLKPTNCKLSEIIMFV